MGNVLTPTPEAQAVLDWIQEKYPRFKRTFSKEILSFDINNSYWSLISVAYQRFHNRIAVVAIHNRIDCDPCDPYFTTVNLSNPELFDKISEILDKLVTS